MILIIIATCCIGIAGAAAFATPSAFEDNADEEIESLKVCEGENPSFSIQIESSEEDPQVFVTLLSNSSSSESLVAQLNCINGKCSRRCWRAEDSLLFDGENMILMNVSYSRAGVYKLSKLSGTQEEKMYNLTVFSKYYTEPPLSSLSPPRSTSALYNISITAGSTVVGILLVLIIAATIISVSCRKAKHKTVTFNQVSQDDDRAASSSTCVIVEK